MRDVSGIIPMPVVQGSAYVAGLLFLAPLAHAAGAMEETHATQTDPTAR